MQKNDFRKKGFSLVEIIFAVVIFIFILAALVFIYVNYSKFYNRQQAELKIGDSAREAAKELQADALQGDQIVANHSFSGVTYTTGQHALVLELPSMNATGEIVSDKHDYVVFYLSGKNLYRLVQIDAASSRAQGLNKISDSVSSLNFTYNNPNLTQATKIDTDLQMQTTSGGQNIFYHFRQEIYLRNI
jgi:type II secretory pathway pseudopilin PulG